MGLTKVTYAMIEGASVNVLDYGAVGDGSNDDTTAIQSAINSGALSIYFPPGTYNISSSLTQADGQMWFGLGGQRATTIKKVANIDMVTMSNQGKLYGLNFDGNGGTYTGKGISITAGNNQIIEDVRITNTAGVALYFGDELGSGVNIKNLVADTNTPTSVAAVRFGASATNSFPKFIDGLWLSGGLIDLTANTAGRDVCINNFFLRNITTSSTTGRFYMSNGRFASLTDTTTLSGTDFSFCGVAFSGPVALSNAQGIRFSSCSFGTGITEDVATCSKCEYVNGANPYTPTWTQSSGTQPDLGNGTLTGYYTRIEKVCTVTIRLIAGSTTTFGNSGVKYLFSLPFIATSTLDQRMVGGSVYSTSTTTSYICEATVGGGEQNVSLSFNNVAVKLNSPATWQTGDVFDISFTYTVK